MNRLSSRSARDLDKALKAYRQEKMKLALTLCGRVLKAAPDDPGALEIAAYAAAFEDPASAPGYMTRLLEQVPATPALLHDLGLMHDQAGQPGEAVRVFEQSLALSPDSVDTLSSLALAESNAGAHEQAEIHARRAVTLDPDMAGGHINLGIVLEHGGKVGDALTAYRDAIRLSPGNANAWFNLARALDSLGNTNSALDAYERAAAAAPADLSILTAKAESEIGAGRFDAAEETLRRQLAADPAFTTAYVNLTRSLRSNGEDVSRMSQLLRRRDLSGKQKADLNFALGRVEERRQNHAGAFRRFSTACRIHRKMHAFDMKARAALVDNARALFSKAPAASGSAVAARTPVFIVGMPRSGSTLVEQILAGHPRVFGGDEVPWLEEALRREGLADGSALRLPKDENERGRVRRAYLGRFDSIAGDAPVVTDKMLDNYLYVGFIAEIFPDAPILHMCRNPVDTCVSCYTQYFTNGHIYSFDQRELGQVYGLYRSLMDHWRETLGDRLLDVRYEHVVAGPEAETRRILAHCGLDWDPACLEFQKTERRVRTASSTQVRGELHTRSVERWRAYEPWIGPLLGELNKIPGLDY